MQTRRNDAAIAPKSLGDLAHRIRCRVLSVHAPAMIRNSAIRQVEDDLCFDAAFRHAPVNGHPAIDIRAGLTFAFKERGRHNADQAGGPVWHFGLSC